MFVTMGTYSSNVCLKGPRTSSSFCSLLSSLFLSLFYSLLIQMISHLALHLLIFVSLRLIFPGEHRYYTYKFPSLYVHEFWEFMLTRELVQREFLQESSNLLILMTLYNYTMRSCFPFLSQYKLFCIKY